MSNHHHPFENLGYDVEIQSASTGKLLGSIHYTDIETLPSQTMGYAGRWQATYAGHVTMSNGKVIKPQTPVILTIVPKCGKRLS